MYLIHQIGTHRKIQCIYHEIETQLKICWNKATRKYRMWMNVKTKLEEPNPIKRIEIRGLNETIFVKTKAHLILLANQNQQRNNFKWFSIEIQHLNSVLSVDWNHIVASIFVVCSPSFPFHRFKKVNFFFVSNRSVSSNSQFISLCVLN